ncbi:MAG: hypothetical protein C4527_13135 [Candidatus Omnitrophota bacterium]|jgi:deoxyhypusine synthase|nr:MAG: hypothetical protein C4527_13135 [Candidatus Omnitrophota bacterium]
MDFSKLKRTSIYERKSLVEAQSISEPPASPSSFHDFFQSLPDYLKARDLRSLVTAIHDARKLEKPFIWMMGAHSIKVGLSPWIIQAIRRGLITAVAMNGACIVHDFELALAGTTSEDVAEALQDGSFGMTKETGATLNHWIKEAAQQDRGLGNYVGEQISGSTFSHKRLSILAAAHECKIPLTVHLGIGTDVIHHHPEASGEALGKTSLADFHTFCDTVSQIGDGGVVLNVGSNVLLPEVFLKALTVARNICGKIGNFTTANFDMIQHYRPNVNVVRRPTLDGGTGYSFTGHHEIMLPLLFTALFEQVEKNS